MSTVQPSKGRYFAVVPAEAWAEARRCGLVTDDPARPTTLVFANPKRRWAPNVLLLALEGPREIWILSVPERLDHERGRRAMVRALEVAAQHRDLVADWTQLKQLAVLVLLTADDTLAVVARTTWCQERKYRSSAKFSTAFKLRPVKTQDLQVATYAL